MKLKKVKKTEEDQWKDRLIDAIAEALDECLDDFCNDNNALRIYNTVRSYCIKNGIMF